MTGISATKHRPRIMFLTLEDTFIALTGHSIREAEAAPIDRMRLMRRVWLGRR